MALLSSIKLSKEDMETLKTNLVPGGIFCIPKGTKIDGDFMGSFDPSRDFLSDSAEQAADRHERDYLLGPAIGRSQQDAACAQRYAMQVAGADRATQPMHDKHHYRNGDPIEELRYTEDKIDHARCKEEHHHYRRKFHRILRSIGMHPGEYSERFSIRRERNRPSMHVHFNEPNMVEPMVNAMKKIVNKAGSLRSRLQKETDDFIARHKLK